MNTNHDTSAPAVIWDDTTAFIFDRPCTGPFPTETLNIPIIKVTLDPLTGRPELQRPR